MSYLDHLHEETLEAYVMGNLPEQEINSLEDHLLLCEHCQLQTRHVELDWKAKRLALQRVRDSRGTPMASLWQVWEGMFGSPAKKAGWVMACAAAAIAVFPYLPSAQESNLAYRNIELSAMRGGEELPAPVQSNERLRLHLDLTELDKLSVYHVVVVDASGDPVWQADQPNRGEEKLDVTISKRLVAGSYWVRLMDTAANRRLLREYPLPLR